MRGRRRPRELALSFLLATHGSTSTPVIIITYMIKGGGAIQRNDGTVEEARKGGGSVVTIMDGAFRDSMKMKMTETDGRKVGNMKDIGRDRSGEEIGTLVTSLMMLLLKVRLNGEMAMSGNGMGVVYLYKDIILNTTITITIILHLRVWIQLGCTNMDPDFAFSKKMLQTLQKRVTGLACLGDAIGGA